MSSELFFLFKLHTFTLLCINEEQKTGSLCDNRQGVHFKESILNRDTAQKELFFFWSLLHFLPIHNVFPIRPDHPLSTFPEHSKTCEKKSALLKTHSSATYLTTPSAMNRTAFYQRFQLKYSFC